MRIQKNIRRIKRAEKTGAKRLKAVQFLLFLLCSTLTTLNISAAQSNAAPSLTNSSLRIVSLSPTATEDLFAIGAGKFVVATDSYSYYPKQAPVTQLEAYNPNVEAIVAYKPTLVVMQSTATGVSAVVKQLAALHIRSYVEVTPDNITGAYAEMEDLGKLTGFSKGAHTLISSMKSRIAQILSTVKIGHSLSFYHELDNTYYSITSDTFIGKVYKDFGLTNIADAAASADDGGYPQLQSEYIVKSNPQIIFLADGNAPDGNENYTTVKKRAGWSNIAAVKKNNVISLPSDIPSRWGPRLVNFYGFVAKSILRVEGK